MSNPSKTKGTFWESAIVAYLNTHGHPGVERRALAGNTDKGDIAGLYVDGLGACVVEAKNCAKLEFSKWLTELHIETLNAKASVGVVWAKRRLRSNPEDAYVVMTGATFLKLIGRHR